MLVFTMATLIAQFHGRLFSKVTGQKYTNQLNKKKNLPTVSEDVTVNISLFYFNKNEL